MPDEKKLIAESTERNADEAAAAEESLGAESQGSGSLDFENLDLSVESVDERISPSETNVFDK